VSLSELHATRTRILAALHSLTSTNRISRMCPSADLLCSLVLLPSLCPGAAFCALLLTADTVKFLCRFVLGTAFTRLEASFPQLRKNCCGFTHLTQLPPQGYTPQPPQGFARPSYPRKGTLRNPRKGSLVPTLVHNTLLQTPTRVR
jgi:hypothetical protein